MADRRKALVIGGGIGGLATALALHRVGLEVAVYERASQLREVPAGLSLWANAIRALRALGLDTPVQTMGVPQRSIGFRSRHGWRLIEVPWEEMTQRFGEAAVCVHRAELLALLEAALPPGTVRLSCSCTGFKQTDAEVTAFFQGNERISGDILIGADGLHSTVREQLWGIRQPRYGGYTAWRAVTHFPHERLTPGESWGRGLRFGQMPMNHGRVYWYATHAAPEGQDLGRVERKQELMRMFNHWHKPIVELIEATDERAILRNDAYDRLPLEHWGTGRVTLVGDAAHPMTPDLGQGACQALEDAVVLGRCLLARPTDPGGAMRDYEGLRHDRTARIAGESRKIATMSLHRSPVLCLARNVGMLLPTTRWRMLRRWQGVMGFVV